MQQPMNQPEPIGGQQAVQQQMVLCPVRFVYETQVLVQPGDQIQPNQTFFINPQNPPPWMQNRPAPNPVVYVQQLPNNMLQPVQQSMDQNQLYLQQNFANFQLQQHMLAQNHQEMRPIQFANIPNVPNMVQNVQQNIQSNERNINQNPNTGQMQANPQNMMQNQMTVARQIPNQGNQTVEVQRQVQFMNMRPQMGQQMNIARPVMSLNQLQNMQAMANMQNLQIQQGNAGQTFVQNIGQQRMPQNVNAVRPQIMPNNVMNVQNVNNGKPPPQEANKTMNNAGTPVPNVRNFAQNYNCRPIQPRRRFNDNGNNVPKMQQQNVPVQQPKMQPQNIQQQQQQQHIPVETPPTQQHQYINQDTANSHQIITNTATNTTYLNNPNMSRKRKSESPDEIQNKIAVPPGSQPIYQNLQQGIIITKMCNEIGTNTSPVHKPKLNVNVSNQAAQMNQNTSMVKVESGEQSKQDVNHMKHTSTETRPMIAPAPSESDKLIRNTVYTQARGRLLQDKISDNMPQQVVENRQPESVQNTTENKTNIEAQTNRDTEMTEVPTDKVITVTIQSEKGATVSKAQADTIESRIIQILESIPKNKNTQTVETEPVKVKKDVSKEIKVEDAKSNDKNVSNENNASKSNGNNATKTNEDNVGKRNENNANKTNENNANKTNENDGSKTILAKSEPQEEKTVTAQEITIEVKEEKVVSPEKAVTKQDILTHVVDGYVIQESNFAFPIRKPLIEKTLQANPKAESESMDALKECMKEEMKNTGVDVQLLPFHYLLLHCEKKKEEEEMEDSKKPNPFTDLLHTTVKSWTVEDLSNHLLKYDWNETVSVFQDHEIDGESLFLVSKTQLISEPYYSQKTNPQTSKKEEITQTEVKQEDNNITPQPVAPTEDKDKNTVAKEEYVAEETVPPTEVREETFDQEECIAEVTVPPTEDREEKFDQEESVAAETVPPTEVREETFDQEESVAAETVLPTEVRKEIFDQEESVAEEMVSPIEVRRETFDQERSATEEPLAPPEVEEDEYVDEEEGNGDRNPFARLQQSTVKSWTVDDLSNHLQQYQWEETASILEDNEVDGASLFLVTKTQLMIIGVDEEQADVISEFVQGPARAGN